MSLPAEDVVRAWVNAREIMPVDDRLPIWRGAFLLEQASPDTGAYVVLARSAEPPLVLVAEGQPFTVARLQGSVYAGTQEAAENAAAALRSAWESLTGCPEPCGDTGVMIMVTDNHLGPVFQPAPPNGGEEFCFQVSADFVLMAM